MHWHLEQIIYLKLAGIIICIWGEEINIKLTDALKKLAKNKIYKDIIFWSGNGIKLNKEYKNQNLNSLFLIQIIMNVILSQKTMMLY